MLKQSFDASNGTGLPYVHLQSRCCLSRFGFCLRFCLNISVWFLSIITLQRAVLQSVSLNGYTARQFSSFL